jgi:hypothetical protein
MPGLDLPGITGENLPACEEVVTIPQMVDDTAMDEPHPQDALLLHGEFPPSRAPGAKFN